MFFFIRSDFAKENKDVCVNGIGLVHLSFGIFISILPCGISVTGWQGLCKGAP